MTVFPAVTRCPSHNAFKCFGECGNKDCNTHFLEHSAYLEHVKMAMKKLAQPLDTCIKVRTTVVYNVISSTVLIVLWRGRGPGKQFLEPGSKVLQKH